MKVGVFLSTSSENQEKRKYLEAFAAGVYQSKTDTAFLSNSDHYKKCDIAVIFGFYGQNLGEIHQARKQIYQEHTRSGKKCIFIDADLFRFLGKKTSNEETHVRISYDSIFFDKAYHFNENSDSKRWELIKKRKQIDLLDYRSDGEHILLCLNSNPYDGRGWSAGETDIYQWTKETIKEIRKYSDRKILVRFHPNVKEKEQKRIPLKELLDQNTFFSGGILSDHEHVIHNTSLIQDCQNAWACVVHNTSASTTPIIQGIPVFTKMKNCPVYSIANHDLSKINEPKMIDRNQWLYDTSYALWHFQEIKSGQVWERFRERLNERGEYSKKSAKKLGL